jgi:DNA-directed RNA polymerase subunit H (RpoH/RPB5)
MGKKFKVESHNLVLKHVKLSDAEVKKLLEKYNIPIKELPKILITDPVIAELNVKTGSVMKIVRPSGTSGEATYYREVING